MCSNWIQLLCNENMLRAHYTKRYWENLMNFSVLALSCYRLRGDKLGSTDCLV